MEQRGTAHPGLYIGAKFVDHDHFQFLDLRTKEEHDHLLFPFATHIPIHELPNRIDEVTHDKFVITFCLSGFRAMMGYTYLRTHGYVEIKALKGRLINWLARLPPTDFTR